jgi:hypothetical protein
LKTTQQFRTFLEVSEVKSLNLRSFFKFDKDALNPTSLLFSHIAVGIKVGGVENLVKFIIGNNQK